MRVASLSNTELSDLQQTLSAQYEHTLAEKLNLDLTRGKPSAQQLSLADRLDGLLKGGYTTDDGVDTRNYGNVYGIAELRKLGGEIMGLPAKQVMAGGNASLTLMFQCVQHAFLKGFYGPESAWMNTGHVKMLCPSPGYDRHFSISQYFGIEMIPVPMTSTGPDMEVVTELVKHDPSILGIWCVPKYSNPTGVIYDQATVEAIANLAALNPGFIVFWDNAYALHDLVDTPNELACIHAAAEQAGTQNSILHFCSTSKITHAGAGVAFLGATEASLKSFAQSLQVITIGPDKVNQLRHAKLFPSKAALLAHMREHAKILRPRFELVLKHLNEAFGESDLGRWETPEGGYFISFDTNPGLAKRVVELAGNAGVKLTPAGATFPYRNDPNDANIRIAPSVPTLAELESAMKVFVLCVQLASVEQALARA